jgi:hypothetical protein
VVAVSSAWITAIGAFLAGVGSLLGGIAAVTYARKKGKEEAKDAAP